MRTYLTALALLLAVLVHGSPRAVAGDCCRGAKDVSVAPQVSETLDLETADYGCTERADESHGGCCGSLCACDEDCGCSDLDVSSAAALLLAPRGPPAALVIDTEAILVLPARGTPLHGRTRIEASLGRRRSGLLLDARVIPLRT